MSPEEVAGALRVAAEHAIRFRKMAASMPQRPAATYAEVKHAFSGRLPDEPSPPEAIIAELVEKASMGLMMPTGRRFFGWVIGSSHPIGVAADWLTSAWGQNAANHHASPAAAAAELAAEGWLLELLNLPRKSSVGMVTGATMANFTCLAAARGEVLRRVGWDVEGSGLFGAPPISVLIGEEAHATVYSALQFLGLGHDRVVKLATDRQGAVLPAALGEALEKLSGPAIVVLQAGQINTGAFDPFAALVPLAKAKGAWVHVDGAFGLWARVSPALRGLTDGVEGADSWATDGHKWLQTPYECGYAIVHDEAAHRRAMTIAASYLPEAAEGERDPSHYVPELSRRARGFPTWCIIKTLGQKGIVEMVERHCRVARLMAERLKMEPGVAVLNEVALNQVIVRFCGSSEKEGDRLTRDTIAEIQRAGICFAGGADWRGRRVMRLSVIGGETTEEDGEVSTAAILDAYRRARVRLDGGQPAGRAFPLTSPMR